MADMGIHALDTARFLLGDPKPVSVYAKIGTYYRDFDVDDTGVIIVEWDNGATSTSKRVGGSRTADSPEAARSYTGPEGFGDGIPNQAGSCQMRQKQKIDLDRVRTSHARIALSAKYVR